jgi:hypothetical protein
MTRVRSADDRLPKIVLFSKQPRETFGRQRLGWEYVVKRHLSKIGNSWEGVKREALDRLGWRKGMYSCVSVRWFGAEVSC